MSAPLTLAVSLVHRSSAISSVYSSGHLPLHLLIPPQPGCFVAVLAGSRLLLVLTSRGENAGADYLTFSAPYHASMICPISSLSFFFGFVDGFNFDEKWLWFAGSIDECLRKAQS